MNVERDPLTFHKDRCYKIVRWAQKEVKVGRTTDAVSTWASSAMYQESGLMMEYRHDRPTVAKFGGLLVFETLTAAAVYSHKMGMTVGTYFESGYGLFQCDCWDRVQLPDLRLMNPHCGSCNSLYQLSVVWEKKSGKAILEALDGADLVYWPGGSVAYRFVQLRGDMIPWSDIQHALRSIPDSYNANYED